VDVFLVPVGRERYELYCEVHEPADPVTAREERPSWGRRRLDRFRTMLHEAEQERIRRERGESDGRRGVGRWVLRKVAEAVAEQRLLWNLRRLDGARLVHPDDTTAERAQRELRRQLGADLAKHRRWMIVDGLSMAITGPLFFFVPGPNVISWYFAFRALGHYFAWRGAAHGLAATIWRAEASSELSGLRHALLLAPLERRARIERLSEALGLAHLASFVERVAARSPAMR
jgi:hypothetical protein